MSDPTPSIPAAATAALPLASAVPSPRQLRAELEDLVLRDLLGPRPHDQKLIDLAVATAVDALVTGDPDLRDLAGVLAVTVLTPAQLREKLRLAG